MDGVHGVVADFKPVFNGVGGVVTICNPRGAGLLSFFFSCLLSCLPNFEKVFWVLFAVCRCSASIASSTFSCGVAYLAALADFFSDSIQTATTTKTNWNTVKVLRYQWYQRCRHVAC